MTKQEKEKLEKLAQVISIETLICEKLDKNQQKELCLRLNKKLKK